MVPVDAIVPLRAPQDAGRIGRAFERRQRAVVLLDVDHAMPENAQVFQNLAAWVRSHPIRVLDMAELDRLEAEAVLTSGTGRCV